MFLGIIVNLDLFKQKGEKMTKKERVQRLKDSGYNPIHLVRNIYLVRNLSRNYKKFSFYGLMLIKDKKQL